VNRTPLPPFNSETAAQKVRMAEDAWNTRDPARVVLAYTTDSRWRNRVEFLAGSDAIHAFLVRKWSRELDYRLIKELWAFAGNRIAVLSGTTTAASGFAVTATKIGNSTSTVSCGCVLPASTICPSPRPSASTAGLRGAGRMIMGL